MNKIIEIYKDAFKTTFELFKTDGFKLVASILALIFMGLTSLFVSDWLSHGCGWYFLLILLGETVLLLPVYVKLWKILDDF
jgi:hypothetical protein